MTETRALYRTRSARREWLESQAECDWQESLIGERGHATVRNWAAYHVPDSRRIQGEHAAGFPDLVLARRESGHIRLLFAELKDETGRVSLDQRWWLDMLTMAGCEVYLWRPSDVEEVQRVLASPVRVESHTEWRFRG